MRGTRRFLAMAGCLLLLVTIVPQIASAQEDAIWYRGTRITVNEPVQIPGHVLEPGVYVMKLANTTDRHVIEVWDATQREMIARFFGTGDPLELEGVDQFADEVILEFEETPAGVPNKVDVWTYTGYSTGLNFVYPDDQEQIVQAWLAAQPATAVAEAERDIDVVIAEPMPEEQAQEDAEPQVQAEAEPQPAPRPERPQAAPPARQPQQEQPRAAQAEPEQEEAQGLAQPRELPRTATSVPLVGLMGLVSLGIGIGLRTISRRTTE